MSSLSVGYMDAEKNVCLLVGARVAAKRGLRSQRDLAKRSGVDISTISRVETGKIDPTLTTLSKIAAGLKVPLSEIFSDEPISGVRVSFDGYTAQVDVRIIEPAKAAGREDLESMATGTITEALRSYGLDTGEQEVPARMPPQPAEVAVATRLDGLEGDMVLVLERGEFLESALYGILAALANSEIVHKTDADQIQRLLVQLQSRRGA